MQLTLTPNPLAMVLLASGRIDQNTSEDFLAALRDQIASGIDTPKPLVIDFSGVEYISSVGLRALMMIAREVKTQQRKLGIAFLQPLVREVFGIARFDLVIPCFENVEGAIGSLTA